MIPVMCQLSEVGSYFTLSVLSYRIVRIRDYSSMPVLLSATSMFLSTPGLVELWNCTQMLHTLVTIPACSAGPNSCIRDPTYYGSRPKLCKLHASDTLSTLV
jgi:hypothetical protein